MGLVELDHASSHHSARHPLPSDLQVACSGDRAPMCASVLHFCISTGWTGDILYVAEAKGARVYSRHVRLSGQMVEALALKSCLWRCKSVRILRQRHSASVRSRSGAIGGSGRTGDVWRRPVMPGTPGSPVDHLQAHGTASAGVAVGLQQPACRAHGPWHGHGRSASGG